eukprot:Rhum_TRINITY_DN14732_c2_g5::Rhum_TRINITY_DN14732_c2_g5_i1::g.112143::m.112143/K10380/ANK; ankyrin
MLVTASWGGEDVAVEVGAECRTLAALKALLQAALPELDVEQTVLAVGGRCVADDEAVCGLEDGAVVALSPTVAARARATLRAEGLSVDWRGFRAAVMDDDVRLSGLYLDAGVSISPGESALHAACGFNSFAVCKLLLDRGFAVGEKDAEKNAPLHHACRVGDAALETVKLLLDRGAAIDGKGCDGNTPLHFACNPDRWADHAEEYEPSTHVGVAKLLLDRGCAIDGRNGGRNAETPLFRACYTGDLEVVKLLLDRGAAVNKKVYTDVTPLHIACNFGHVSIVQLLLDQGAAIDGKTCGGSTPLHEACEQQSDVAKLLLDRGCVIDEPRGSDGTTALHIACNHGLVATVKLLLDRGAAIDPKKRGGSTPLHEACERGHVDVVQLLLDRGCAIDAKSKDTGYAGLHIACRHGHVAVVRLLLDRGCDSTVRNSRGETPIDLVPHSGKTGLRELLLDRRYKSV